VLGQGGRCGGGPAGRATEGNAGPVPFLTSSQSFSDGPDYFKNTASRRADLSSHRGLLFLSRNDSAGRSYHGNLTAPFRVRHPLEIPTGIPRDSSSEMRSPSHPATLPPTASLRLHRDGHPGGTFRCGQTADHEL